MYLEKMYKEARESLIAKGGVGRESWRVKVEEVPELGEAIAAKREGKGAEQKVNYLEEL